MRKTTLWPQDSARRIYVPYRKRCAPSGAVSCQTRTLLASPVDRRGAGLLQAGAALFDRSRPSARPALLLVLLLGAVFWGCSGAEEELRFQEQTLTERVAASADPGSPTHISETEELLRTATDMAPRSEIARRLALELMDRLLARAHGSKDMGALAGLLARRLDLAETLLSWSEEDPYLRSAVVHGAATLGQFDRAWDGLRAWVPALSGAEQTRVFLETLGSVQAEWAKAVQATSEKPPGEPALVLVETLRQRLEEGADVGPAPSIWRAVVLERSRHGRVKEAVAALDRWEEVEPELAEIFVWRQRLMEEPARGG